VRVPAGHRLGSAAGIAMRGSVAEQCCDDFPAGKILTSRIDYQLPQFAAPAHLALALRLLFPRLGTLLGEQVARLELRQSRGRALYLLM
jgi:hypothetical protein